MMRMGNKVKALLAVSTVTSFALAATALDTAHAATVYQYYSTTIQVNGTTVSAPGHLVAKDPFGGSNGQATSFLPIWYVDQALGKFNVTVSWDGTKGVLNLTTPSWY